MPVKAPSDLNGEEGNLVTQDNSGSAIPENPITTSNQFKHYSFMKKTINPFLKSKFILNRK